MLLLFSRDKIDAQAGPLPDDVVPIAPSSVPPLAGAMVKYSKASESATSCKARGCDLRVHFKVCRVGRPRFPPTPR